MVQATNHHIQAALDMVVMLALFLVELSVSVELLVSAELLVLVDHLMNHHQQTSKCNNMLLMLKVSLSTKTHKSSVVQLPVVYKHTHKTSKFDSFNHPLSHPQA